MSTAILDASPAVPKSKQPPDSSDLSRVREEWELLAEGVREFDPTIVVLVARKPVRMFQALGLEPAPGALVVSDLAIPFLGDRMASAKVAVVDDVVNVGSTLRRVCRLAVAAGSSEVQAFAISHLRREDRIEDLDVRYTRVDGLDEFDLRQFGRRIPQTLQWHSKPYDLTFPVMERELRAPFWNFDFLLAALRNHYGDEFVYDLSTAAGAECGKRRCAVDLTDGPALRKMNLYVDEAARTCAVVPIALTPVLQADEPALHPSPWAAAVWSGLKDLPHDGDLEALCRLSLFADGLTLGESFIAEHGAFLRNHGSRPFSLTDAQLALGPAVAKVRAADGDQPLRRFRSRHPEDAAAASPFLAAAKRSGMLSSIENAARARDPLSVFIATFEVLGRNVGAHDPSQYKLDWPYTYSEVQQEPSLRLRIGPTIADLVEIVDSITGANDLSLTRRRVTRLLDRYIDSGGVVPTVATYDDTPYRIYREGEASTREDVSLRVKYAWECYGKPLSLTRATKYLTILALDLPQSDSQVVIGNAPRGNTLCFNESILDTRTEITQYLRDTDQLERADKKK